MTDDKKCVFVPGVQGCDCPECSTKPQLNAYTLDLIKGIEEMDHMAFLQQGDAVGLTSIIYDLCCQGGVMTSQAMAALASVAGAWMGLVEGLDARVERTEGVLMTFEDRLAIHTTILKKAYEWAIANRVSQTPANKVN